MPGHKNSEGEKAEWVIVSHDTGKILSSHKSKSEAESHLQDMHAHSSEEKVGVEINDHVEDADGNHGEVISIGKDSKGRTLVVVDIHGEDQYKTFFEDELKLVESSLNTEAASIEKLEIDIERASKQRDYFISKLKEPSDKPTPALTAESIIVKIGHTGLTLIMTAKTRAKSF